MTDPLSYDSFHDPHLQTYFGNKNVRKHLRKVGLLNRHGEVIPYKEYQAKINERSRQEHVRALLSHGVVQRVIELEKARQANIRNQFERAAKRIHVENVKESRQQYKQIRSKDFILLNRPKTNINPIHQQQIKITDEYKETPSRLSSAYPSRLSSAYPSRLSSVHPSRSPVKPIRHKSPKMKSNVNIKDRCVITMVYLGGQMNLDYDQSFFQPNGIEIMIMQQHCGGENLIVFKNFVKPNEKFQFESHRHNEYPFALSLYVNGLIECRISVCCEYKHKFGVPLGGKKGSFAILNIQGGQPCQTCRFNEYMANAPLFKPNSLDQNSIITDTSKTLTSDQSTTHQLLRTPVPYDEHEKDTTISNQNNEYCEAQEMYENLLKKVNKNINWKENGYLQSQLGNICKEGLGDYDKALEHYLTSLEIFCQNISPLDIKLRNIYLSIAHILLLQGKNENYLSIQYFQRVLDIDYSLNIKNENNLINDHNYIGLLYQNEENFDGALFHFNKSLKYFSLINSKVNENLNFYSNDYLINETIYDKKALQSLSIEKIPNLSEIHFNLATTYQNLGQKQNALKHAQKAFQLATFDQNKFYIYQNYLNKLRHI